MRIYLADCGAKVPQSLTRTNLRKYIAALCIDYYSSENEHENLARFLGYNPTIQIINYRLRFSETGVHDIAKLLNNVSGSGVDKDIGAHEYETEDENEDDRVSNSIDGAISSQEIVRLYMCICLVPGFYNCSI